MTEKEMPPLTGYWHASGVKVSDWHGHYIETRAESTPVVHKHKGGRRAHLHEEATHPPAECLAKGMFGADCPRCAPEQH